MLDKFDIALLMDAAYTDGSGIYRMRDRSRHGIDARMGDGTTAGTFPTWNANHGKLEFDGGDYLTLAVADDVDGVITGMGSIQDETYCFLFDPWIASAASTICIFRRDTSTPDIYFRQLAAGGNFNYRVESGVASESFNALALMDPFHGQRVLLTITRTTNSQKIYIDRVLAASNVDVSVDGSGTADAYIGSRVGLANFFPPDTGLRFFGYGRFAATPTWIRQLTSYLRGLL